MQQPVTPQTQNLFDKRAQVVVQIRRNLRQSIISKKRIANSTMIDTNPQQQQQQEQIVLTEMISEEQQEPINIQEISEKKKSKDKKKRKMEQQRKRIMLETQKRFDVALTMIRSGVDETVIAGFKEIRKLMCVEAYAPIQEIIDCGLVPFFVQAASQHKEPLKSEAAWILLNMCGGTEQQARFLVERGIIGLIAKFLTFDNIRLIQDAVWSFGNLLAEPTLVSLVTSTPIIESVLEVVYRVPSSHLLLNAAWSFTNMCRNGAILSEQRLKKVTNVMVMAWKTVPSSLTLHYEILWAFSYIADRGVVQEILIQTGMIEKFVQMIAEENNDRKISVLRILSRLCNTEANTSAIFNQRFYFLINACMANTESRIRLQSLHLANKACASSSFVTASLSNSDLFMKYITKMSQHQEQKHLMNIIEICKSFATLLPFKTAVSVFAVHQLMRSFALFLASSEKSELLLQALEGLAVIFQVSESKDMNPFIELFNRNNGVQLLQKLLQNSNEEVYQSAMHIIEQFYEIDNTLI